MAKADSDPQTGQACTSSVKSLRWKFDGSLCKNAIKPADFLYFKNKHCIWLNEVVLTAFSVSVTSGKFPSALILCWCNETGCLTLIHCLVSQFSVTLASNVLSFWQLDDYSFTIYGRNSLTIDHRGSFWNKWSHERSCVCFTVATLDLVTVTNTRFLAISRAFREFTPSSPISWNAR